MSVSGSPIVSETHHLVGIHNGDLSILDNAMQDLESKPDTLESEIEAKPAQSKTTEQQPKTLTEPTIQSLTPKPTTTQPLQGATNIPLPDGVTVEEEEESKSTKNTPRDTFIPSPHYQYTYESEVNPYQEQNTQSSQPEDDIDDLLDGAFDDLMKSSTQPIPPTPPVSQTLDPYLDLPPIEDEDDHFLDSVLHELHSDAKIVTVAETPQTQTQTPLPFLPPFEEQPKETPKTQQPKKSIKKGRPAKEVTKPPTSFFKELVTPLLFFGGVGLVGIAAGIGYYFVKKGDSKN